MTRRSLLSIAILLMTGAGPPALADVMTNPLGSYGRVNQRSIGAPPPGNSYLGYWACGPTAAANSFAYLQNRFGLDLVPDSNFNNMLDRPDIEALARTLASPLYMNQRKNAAGPATPGYEPGDEGYEDLMPRGPNGERNAGGGGTTWEDFAWGKDQWFANRGVNVELRGKYEGMWTNAAPGRQPPAWLHTQAAISIQDIAAEVAAGKDVEIGFVWEELEQAEWVPIGGHFVTVYGFEYVEGSTPPNGQWDPGETVTALSFIDPWDPAAMPRNPLDPNDHALVGMAPALTGVVMNQPQGNVFQYAGVQRVSRRIPTSGPASSCGPARRRSRRRCWSSAWRGWRSSAGADPQPEAGSALRRTRSRAEMLASVRGRGTAQPLPAARGLCFRLKHNGSHATIPAVLIWAQPVAARSRRALRT